ncbi:MAG: hypothetical protein ACYSWZ_26730 [Planctomycetota bacterium]
MKLLRTMTIILAFQVVAGYGAAEKLPVFTDVTMSPKKRVLTSSTAMGISTSIISSRAPVRERCFLTMMETDGLTYIF